MTLRCTCGGAVQLQDVEYTESFASEAYECQHCGGTGYLSIGPDGDSKSGCLVENGDY